MEQCCEFVPVAPQDGVWEGHVIRGEVPPNACRYWTPKNEVLGTSLSAPTERAGTVRAGQSGVRVDRGVFKPLPCGGVNRAALFAPCQARLGVVTCPNDVPGIVSAAPRPTCVRKPLSGFFATFAGACLPPEEYPGDVHGPSEIGGGAYDL